MSAWSWKDVVKARVKPAAPDGPASGGPDGGAEADATGAGGEAPPDVAAALAAAGATAVPKKPGLEAVLAGAAAGGGDLGPDDVVRIYQRMAAAGAASLPRGLRPPSGGGTS
jgi:hypothetical protein